MAAVHALRLTDAHSVVAWQLVLKRVTVRFNDDAASVREAVVKLVGTYVEARPELCRKYFPHLLKLLNDSGGVIGGVLGVRLSEGSCSLQVFPSASA